MPKTIHRRARLIGRVSAIALAACCAAGVLLPQAAVAQSATAARTFDLPAGDLASALSRFGEQTGLALVYPAELARGKGTGGVSGSMTPAEALSRLLAGTGLTFRFDGASTLVIQPASTDGEVVTGAVQVEGVQGSPYFGGAGQAAGVNGVNGSRDITATEGTGSFTSGALTIGSKVPQALKDVPQSISVLTSERMEQQNVTDFNTAMAKLPGVTLVQGPTSLENTFYSRGFAITNIQVDGGAPLTTNYSFYPQIDMSIYDHVELVRGADGLFSGYGDPSGTVNLVRKKPLDHAQVSVEAQAGSWSTYRLVADATSPLALDGRLRGRLVMTYQDNHYFYAVAKSNKTLIYGITEFDATPTTLLTAGLNYTRQDSVPWRSGLPRYQTGDDLGLPRSTSIVFPWNRWNLDTTEIFGGIEQKFGKDWNLKLNLTYNRQTTAQKFGYNNVAVNPENNLGPMLIGLYADQASKQFSAEFVTSGSFEILGQRQEITAGANRVDSDGGGLTYYAALVPSSYLAPYQPYPGGPQYCVDNLGRCPVGTIAPARPPINVFDFDPYDALYTEPRNPLPNLRNPVFGQIQSGAYVNLRLTAFDRVHLTTGLRWSHYEYEQASESLCTVTTGDCAGLQIGDAYAPTDWKYSDTDISWPPPANLSFDLTKQLTGYIGYTDIYLSQASMLDSSLKPIDPVTGSNIEAGLKWAARGGRLNVLLSAYRIKQKGFGTVDGVYDDDTGEFVASDGKRFPNFGSIDDSHSCCFKSDPDRTLRSKGIDFEATGEIADGLQIAASYTYNETKQEGVYFGTAEGAPVVSIQPKHLYKLWLAYDFSASGREGPLAGLSVSGGINGQSSGYNEGAGCKPEYIVTNAVTGAASCGVIDGESGSYTYKFTVPAYALLSARIDYRFSDKWSLALNLDNILDKTYYQTAGSVTGGNWYGAPRSFTASLRAKW
ncbi:MAG: TonB-dependent receptor [Candidatus Andeanibacterium colombiense]|uniref:TonB-dependent receptor n=1 Tax=Candidatus Andeanibacterium colombiense TaxID=3121345 RepID=A0AAJ5X725_9SPHN|nr:MAG: TonB-dependent receptor [Sphingomonadaceae bacterium]